MGEERKISNDEAIDLLLRSTTADGVVVRKIEILVPLSSFKNKHVPSELISELVDQGREPYIYEGDLVIKRH